MNFTRGNFPVLHWHGNKNSSISHFQWGPYKQKQEIFEFFDEAKESGSFKDVAYISTPFFNAIQASSKKLFELIDIEKFIGEGDLKGILLLPNGIQIVYDFWNAMAGGTTFTLDTSEGTTEDFEDAIQQRDLFVLDKTNVIGWGSQEVSERFGIEPERGAFSEAVNGLNGKYWHDLVLAYHLFKRYADVETKVLDPTKPARDFNTAYVNHSKSIVTVYDSTWFTTLIRSDAFKVQGHFRFQPVGEGRKDRKLIWIKEHQREGYTRTAKMLPSSDE